MHRRVLRKDLMPDISRNQCCYRLKLGVILTGLVLAVSATSLRAIAEQPTPSNTDHPHAHTQHPFFKPGLRNNPLRDLRSGRTSYTIASRLLTIQQRLSHLTEQSGNSTRIHQDLLIELAAHIQNISDAKIGKIPLRIIDNQLVEDKDAETRGLHISEYQYDRDQLGLWQTEDTEITYRRPATIRHLDMSLSALAELRGQEQSYKNLTLIMRMLGNIHEKIPEKIVNISRKITRSSEDAFWNISANNYEEFIGTIGRHDGLHTALEEFSPSIDLLIDLHNEEKFSPWLPEISYLNAIKTQIDLLQDAVHYRSEQAQISRALKSQHYFGDFRDPIIQDSIIKRVLSSNKDTFAADFKTDRHNDTMTTQHDWPNRVSFSRIVSRLKKRTEDEVRQLSLILKDLPQDATLNDVLDNWITWVQQQAELIDQLLIQMDDLYQQRTTMQEKRTISKKIVALQQAADSLRALKSPTHLIDILTEIGITKTATNYPKGTFDALIAPDFLDRFDRATEILDTEHGRYLDGLHADDYIPTVQDVIAKGGEFITKANDFLDNEQGGYQKRIGKLEKAAMRSARKSAKPYVDALNKAGQLFDEASAIISTHLDTITWVGNIKTKPLSTDNTKTITDYRFNMLGSAGPIDLKANTGVDDKSALGRLRTAQREIGSTFLAAADVALGTCEVYIQIAENDKHLEQDLAHLTRIRKLIDRFKMDNALASSDLSDDQGTGLPVILEKPIDALSSQYNTVLAKLRQKDKELNSPLDDDELGNLEFPIDRRPSIATRGTRYSQKIGETVTSAIEAQGEQDGKLSAKHLLADSFQGLVAISNTLEAALFAKVLDEEALEKKLTDSATIRLTDRFDSRRDELSTSLADFIENGTFEGGSLEDDFNLWLNRILMDKDELKAELERSYGTTTSTEAQTEAAAKVHFSVTDDRDRNQKIAKQLGTDVKNTLNEENGATALTLTAIGIYLRKVGGLSSYWTEVYMRYLATRMGFTIDGTTGPVPAREFGEHEGLRPNNIDASGRLRFYRTLTSEKKITPRLAPPITFARQLAKRLSPLPNDATAQDSNTATISE